MTASRPFYFIRLPGEGRGPGEAHETLRMNLGPGLRREDGVFVNVSRDFQQ
jgi:hypothetical protein